MNYTFIGNDALSWSMALGVGLAALALMYAAKHVVLIQLRRLAARTQTYLDDIAASVLSSTSPAFLWAGAVYAASLTLTLTPKLDQLFAKGMLVAVLLQVALWGDLGIREWLRHYRSGRQGNDAASTTSTAALGFMVRTAVWVVVVLMVLDNFGVNITTLVASLGIGGIAVALALQNVLGDLFSSLSILLDKPFVIGDFIVVDGVPGTVEYVGLKTTRLRGLGGEQVIFSNSDLLKIRIHNYKRMESRRIAFTIGLTYQTAPEQLAELPGVLGEIVAAQPGVTFDRAHFKSFGAYSLDFEIVYFVDSADYAVYMDVQQEINLALFERFAQMGIEFAFPSQTLHHVGLGVLAEAALRRGTAANA